MENYYSRQVLPEDLPVYDGLILPAFQELSQDAKKKIEAIRNLESRERSHWVSEIVEQLLAGKAEYSGKAKGDLFLEARDFVEHRINDIPSPRNLNTHLPFRMLPLKHIELNAKIIHILRNPKDVAVSAFHHSQKDVDLGHSHITSWDEFIDIFPNKWQIGDWKNWFTVAQNERFDAIYRDQMKDSDLKLIFSC
ncbi:hypothetical protein KUTeg_022974 [Tegillarca granosa]|uniref:Sulfotransferase domain-containing protein n=1 Tax=Tegillarca granosa TaxID=220873 RepID=A0ABQ9E0R5_TEGGR|nr:hypothetical protein KUTeg_022974 [Tegillarca granosa]